MDEFEIVTTVDCPTERVFAALHDFDNVPSWNPGVAEVRWDKDGSIGVGSTVVYVGRFLGRTFESTSEIAEYSPNSKLTFKSVSGPFHLEIENNLESVDSGTRLTALYRGESRGFFKLAEPVVIHLAKKQFETAQENLKALLEAGALPA